VTQARLGGAREPSVEHLARLFEVAFEDGARGRGATLGGAARVREVDDAVARLRRRCAREARVCPGFAVAWIHIDNTQARSKVEACVAHSLR
jgi:hypothetical protein